jgi:outer membrane protein
MVDMKFNWMIAVAGCVSASFACADDLASVYNKSLSADPTMQQAEFVRLSTREVKTQALLNLVPINGYATKSWVDQGNGVTTNPAVATLNVSVNLLSWNSWINLKSANATVTQSQANYEAAKEDLISRVSQRYFAVLSAQDQLAALDTALQSAERQLEQAERRFEVGLIAVTDVQIARASRDSSSADVIEGRRTVAAAEEQLRAITGDKYPKLAAPRADMPLLTPSPASEDAWVSTALEQNASLVASRLAAEISRDQYLSAIGGHIPNITASANRNWLLSGRDNPNVTTTTGGVTGTLNTNDITWAISVNVPLFTAGATQSKVRQAKYSWDAAKSAFERSLRSTEQQTRDAYQGVISQIAQVQALRQAVESNRVSLQATEAGYEVGTKTALDVLTARQLLVQAQTRYAQAKYGYLNNIVALRLAAGNLDPMTITQINGWLTEVLAETDTLSTSPAGDAAPAGAPLAPATAPGATATPITPPAATAPPAP